MPPGIRKSIDWLVSQQHADGGWGEDGISYYDGHHGEGNVSTASQTAWAVLGLMAAGAVDHLIAGAQDGVAHDAPQQRAAIGACGTWGETLPDREQFILNTYIGMGLSDCPSGSEGDFLAPHNSWTRWSGVCMTD